MTEVMRTAAQAVDFDFEARPGSSRPAARSDALDAVPALSGKAPPPSLPVGTHRLLEQTASRLTGIRTIPDRLVSLADPDARPIRKGKPQHPT
ncbi:hypothetical protein [Streptomyces halobius]|uniref:Uncharacterized protein n=1 Tax=Streptomyces halobius TaxID=2879846 RepID=A0ABY4MK47_9ACTN|nr:hypothetical protein [Streptomyces halobius]UQA98211.1 hypothetical protein K9S39_41380 [Streptomyces halobius]